MVGQRSTSEILQGEVDAEEAAQEQQYAEEPSIQAGPNKRRRSSGNRTTNLQIRNAPVTFSLRTEHELQQSTFQSPQAPHLEDSNFGVESFQSGVSSTSDFQSKLDTATKDESEGLIQQDLNEPSDLHHPDSTTYMFNTDSILSRLSQPSHAPLLDELARHNSNPILSGPLTPLYLHSPLDGGTEYGSSSTPRTSSLRSLRLSDCDGATDDGRSQAVASSDDDDEVDNDAAGNEQSHNLPQLVMPSIRMPVRRPFTEHGKGIGKLKIAVTGGPGIGKSSLIRSIVQSCEDIVHVDPVATSTSTTSLGSADRTIEIFASTRAYPAWWSDLDDSKVLRRRKSSMSEPVLERNVCFIDTPSISRKAQHQHPTTSVIQHMEHLLQRNESFATLSSGEILSIMSGNGGVQVDLVLYMLSAELSDLDISALKRLSELTNVLPVLAKADTMSENERSLASASIQEQLRSSSIRLASVDNNGSEYSASTLHPRVWHVSSATRRDDELMDASLLMNSEYVQPLAESGLKELVESIFGHDTAAWLRHSSAKKFLQWHRAGGRSISSSNTVAVRSTLQNHPTALTSSSPSQVVAMRPSDTTYLPTTSSPYTLARIRDHTHHEEREAQVHLARWAADLQRSLRNERERFARLQREEQRGWLMKKWEESSGEKADADKMEAQLLRAQHPHIDLRDPLGILAWDDTARARGLVLARVIGGCGMVGAVLVWVMRTWGWTLDGSGSTQPGYT